MLVRSRKERGMRGGAAPSPPCMGAPPHAPGDFLAKRKSPKIRQGPPGPWTSGTRGRTPLDSPAPCPSGIGCGGLNLQASSGASHLPRHGLKAESVPSMKPEEKNKTDLPTQLKVANQSRLVAEGSPARCAASAKRAVTLHRGFQRAQPLARLW